MRNTRLTKNIVLSGIIIILSTGLFGLEVDVDEVKSKKVKFVNYRGRQKKREPVKEIKAIGRKLARKARANKKVRFHMKYSIIHVVSKKEPNKFSADIFSIDRDARVNHIKNVRRIIAAYLETKYGYSRRNAKTLSLFISYYNAVYRGNLKYFSSKYKSAVMRRLNKKNAGISTKYYQWPGATKILIPLTKDSKRGQLDSIDPDIISDKKTIDEIRKDDKNIEDRKDLIDIKKKKLDKEEKDIKKRKKAADDKRKRFEDDKKTIKKKDKDIQKEIDDIMKRDKKIKDEKKKNKTIKDPEKRKKKEEETSKKEKKLEDDKKKTKDKEKIIKREKKKIADRDKKIKREEDKIKKDEEKIRDKKKRVDDEEKVIKKDEINRDIEKDPEKAKKELRKKEKELDEREDKIRDKELDKKVYGLKLYYLKIKEYLEGGHYNNEMYMINAPDAKIEFKSPVKNICGKRYDVFSVGVVVITHHGSHQAGHRLTIIDRKTLKAKTHGKDDVFWRSFIEIKEGFIYVIVRDSGNHYLGKFNDKLQLIEKSKNPISENTFISFYGDNIYINSKDKQIIVLSKKDLSYIKTIKPE